jgi:hypothetical protein
MVDAITDIITKHRQATKLFEGIVCYCIHFLYAYDTVFVPVKLLSGSKQTVVPEKARATLKLSKSLPLLVGSTTSVIIERARKCSMARYCGYQPTVRSLLRRLE